MGKIAIFLLHEFRDGVPLREGTYFFFGGGEYSLVPPKHTGDSGYDNLTLLGSGTCF